MLDLLIKTFYSETIRQWFLIIISNFSVTLPQKSPCSNVLAYKLYSKRSLPFPTYRAANRKMLKLSLMEGLFFVKRSNEGMEKHGEGVRIFFHSRSNLLSQNWKNLNNQRPTEQFCDSFCFLTLLINTGTRQIFYQNQPKNNIKEKNYNKKLYKRYLTIQFHGMVRIKYFSKHLFFENVHDTGRANCLNQLFGILVETEMIFLNGWEISILTLLRT